MPRLNPDAWAAIRTEWEGEPTMTLAALSEKYGVNKSEISRRSKREGWVRRGELVGINEAAQRKADRRVDSDGNLTQPELNSVEFETRDQAEDLRAAVLVRHRGEWADLEKYRRHALKVMERAKEAMDEAIEANAPIKSTDKDAWVAAKAAADTAKANMTTLQIKQDGERKAWGLDDAAIRIDVTRASDEELDAMVKGRG